MQIFYIRCRRCFCVQIGPRVWLAGFVFQSASYSKSLYSPVEQWLTVLQCTSRPTSPESLACHLDWDSHYPHPTNWSFHLTTSLLSASGPFQSPQPISGTVSLVPAHLTSVLPLTCGSVLRLLFRLSYPDSIIWHSEFTFCCGSSSNYVIQSTLKMSLLIMMMMTAQTSSGECSVCHAVRQLHTSESIATDYGSTPEAVLRGGQGATPPPLWEVWPPCAPPP